MQAEFPCIHVDVFLIFSSLGPVGSAPIHIPHKPLLAPAFCEYKVDSDI